MGEEKQGERESAVSEETQSEEGSEGKWKSHLLLMERGCLGGQIHLKGKSILRLWSWIERGWGRAVIDGKIE